jgi:RNA polymerase sigma-70 factor (ECF subfamily)
VGGRGILRPDLGGARAGDEAAFSALWRWAQPSLLRWQRVVAPAADEDLASEVWISVMRGLGSFRGGEREFRSWFFTIARRRAIDLARRRSRRPQTVSLDSVDSPDAVDIGGALAGDAAVDTAIGLLRQLRPVEAEVVALRVIGGLSVAETAAVLGRSESGVRVLCHRGLGHLAALVDRELVAVAAP